MKWIGDRISFKDQKDSISFVILPPKLGGKRFLMLAWLLIWLAIGVYVSVQLGKDYEQQEKLVLIVFMVFWLYFAIRIFRTLIFLFWGREYIKLDQTGLRIKKSIGSYGGVKQYFLENIAKFKLIEIKENSIQKSYDQSPWVRGMDRIEFEYYGKKYTFARKLEDKDVELMYRALARRMERFLRAKK